MITAKDIEHSPTFQKWCDAFRKLGGIEVHFLDSTSLESNLQYMAQSLNFCARKGDCHLSCLKNRIQFAKRLQTSEKHMSGPFAMRCFAGLTVIALPIPLADDTTAYLLTGPVLLKGRGNLSPLKTVIKRIRKAGGNEPTKTILASLTNVPIRDRHHFKASITLLHLLANQISHMSRQMLAPSKEEKDGWITVRRAREVIENQFTEDIHLSEVAKAISVNQSYLSHLFSRQMGLSFTEYLSTRRIIEMKRLLGDSELSVTEIVFAAGFQSISQANRVFRANTGTNPRAYRLKKND